MDTIKQFEPLFGDWYVDSLIGAGSFGRVYKIYRDELDNRFYSALKYISIPMDKAEIGQLRMDGMNEESISTYYTELTKSITEETKLMNRLRGNTNIVSFEDSKVIPKPDGIGYDIFIKMELLTSLPNKLMKGALSKEEIVKLGTDICSALILCQRYGIIHRDIKPDNIFVSDNGAYKLGDFGVARQLEKTAGYMSKKGTYNYMAPEVYRGDKYGVGCDIYSLGLVMYRLLNNGRLPFLPPAPQQISPNDRESALVRRMGGEPIPAPCQADANLAAIVLKACAFDPAQRYQSAGEMRTDLMRYTYGTFVPTAAAPGRPDPDKTVAAPGSVTGPAQQAQNYQQTQGYQQTAYMPPQPPYRQQQNYGQGQTVYQPQQNYGSDKTVAQQPQSYPQAAYQQGYQQPAAAPTQTGGTKKSKKGLIIGLIIALAAVIATVAILWATGVFGDGSSGKSSKDKEDEEDSGVITPTQPPEDVGVPGTYYLSRVNGYDAVYIMTKIAEGYGKTLEELCRDYGLSADETGRLMYVIFFSDGTGRFESAIDEVSESFTWVQNGDTLILTDEYDETMTVTYSGNEIVLTNENGYFTFVKGGN